MTAPFFKFFINGYNNYVQSTNLEYHFSFLYLLDLESKKKYPAPIYI
jgi:hypothetical protein